MLKPLAFPNVGSTCYMNSLLQLIFNSRLCEDITQSAKKNEFCRLLDIIHRTGRKKQLRSFHNLCVTENLINSGAADSYMFLTNLIFRLWEDCEDFFECSFLKYIDIRRTNCECQLRPRNLKVCCQKIQIQTNFSEAVQNMQQINTRSYNCRKCNKFVERHSMLQDYPSVLILSIESLIERRNEELSIELEIRDEPFVLKYEMIGAIIHSGYSSEGGQDNGHYWCIVRDRINPSIFWNCNDSRITKKNKGFLEQTLRNCVENNSRYRCTMISYQLVGCRNISLKSLVRPQAELEDDEKSFSQSETTFSIEERKRIYEEGKEEAAKKMKLFLRNKLSMARKRYLQRVKNEKSQLKKKFEEEIAEKEKKFEEVIKEKEKEMRRNLGRRIKLIENNSNLNRDYRKLELSYKESKEESKKLSILKNENIRLENCVKNMSRNFNSETTKNKMKEKKIEIMKKKLIEWKVVTKRMKEKYEERIDNLKEKFSSRRKVITNLKKKNSNEKKKNERDEEKIETLEYELKDAQRIIGMMSTKLENRNRKTEKSMMALKKKLSLEKQKNEKLKGKIERLEEQSQNEPDGYHSYTYDYVTKNDKFKERNSNCRTNSSEMKRKTTEKIKKPKKSVVSKKKNNYLPKSKKNTQAKARWNSSKFKASSRYGIGSVQVEVFGKDDEIDHEINAIKNILDEGKGKRKRWR